MPFQTMDDVTGIRFQAKKRRLLYCGALFFVQTLAFGAVALDCGIIAKTSHRMAPFFVFDTLPLGVFAAAELEFLLDTS